MVSFEFCVLDTWFILRSRQPPSLRKLSREDFILSLPSLLRQLPLDMSLEAGSLGVPHEQTLASGREDFSERPGAADPSGEDIYLCARCLLCMIPGTIANLHKS